MMQDDLGLMKDYGLIIMYVLTMAQSFFISYLNNFYGYPYE